MSELTILQSAAAENKTKDSQKKRKTRPRTDFRLLERRALSTQRLVTNDSFFI